MACVHVFLRDDQGAITIDWVTLTAGILVLGAMVVYSIFNSASNLVGSVNAEVTDTFTEVDIGTVENLNVPSQ